MGFFNVIDNAVGPLAASLGQKVQRHAAIAANIANVDTPGYKAVDVTFAEELQNAGIQMARTDRGHLTAGGFRPGSSTKVMKLNGVPRRDGNDVNIEHEMVKMAENQIEYRFLTNMLKRRFDKYREAITGRAA